MNTREIMARYNIKPVKTLGQNFLTDPNIIKMIVDSSQTEESDFVIEVGPGLGAMTSELVKSAGKLIAVEIDDHLIPILNELKALSPNMEIIHKDIMKTNINDELISPFYSDDFKKVKVISNLPYYITTPVIMKFLEDGVNHLDSLTFMVQDEVGDRIIAGPGTKDYGAFSVAIAYFSIPSKLFKVPANCFVPRPNVDSCIVQLKIHDKPMISVKNQDYFFKVVKAAFGQRRKTLVNALSNAPYLNVNKEQITHCLDTMGKNLLIRGETLTPGEFGVLADLLLGVQ